MTGRCAPSTGPHRRGARASPRCLLLAGTRDVFWGGDFYVEVYHPAYLPLIRGDVGRLLLPPAGLRGLQRARRGAVGAPGRRLRRARDRGPAAHGAARPDPARRPRRGRSAARRGAPAVRAGRSWSCSARAARSRTRRCSTATRRTSSRARPRCSPCWPPAAGARGSPSRCSSSPWPRSSGRCWPSRPPRSRRRGAGCGSRSSPPRAPPRSCSPRACSCRRRRGT